MDAQALLLRHGWSGPGTPLNPNSRLNNHNRNPKHPGLGLTAGLTKPILATRKNNTHGIGKKTTKDATNQWWLRGFEDALKGIGEQGKQDQVGNGGDGDGRNLLTGELCRFFVRGEILEGTIGDRGRDHDGVNGEVEIKSNSKKAKSASSSKRKRKRDDDDDDDKDINNDEREQRKRRKEAKARRKEEKKKKKEEKTIKRELKKKTAEDDKSRKEDSAAVGSEKVASDERSKAKEKKEDKEERRRRKEEKRRRKSKTKEDAGKEDDSRNEGSSRTQSSSSKKRKKEALEAVRG